MRAHERLLNIAKETVERNRESFLGFLRHRVGPVSAEVLKQEQVQRLIVSRIHGALPLPVRLLVREEKLTNFLMSNKARVMHVLEPLLGSAAGSGDDDSDAVFSRDVTPVDDAKHKGNGSNER